MDSPLANAVTVKGYRVEVPPEVREIDRVDALAEVVITIFFAEKGYDKRAGHNFPLYGKRAWFLSATDKPEMKNLVVNVCGHGLNLESAKAQNCLPDYVFAVRVSPDRKFGEVVGYVELADLVDAEKLGTGRGPQLESVGLSGRKKSEFMPSREHGGKMPLDEDSMLVKYWDLKQDFDVLLAKVNPKVLFSRKSVHCNFCGGGFDTDFREYDGRFCKAECSKAMESVRAESLLGK